MEQILANWHNWLWAASILGGAALLGLLIHRIVFSVAGRIARRTPNPLDQAAVKYARKPARWIIPLVAILAAMPGLPIAEPYVMSIRHAVIIGLIAAVAWMAIELIQVVEDFIELRYRLDVADNLSARRVRTQVQVLRRIVAMVIGVIGLALILMTFPSIWNIGTAIFASAGAAGIVVGMAARPTLANLLAGVQIALTEPIRIDDVVIVDGEWGRIEEIGTTYVVVCIWDLRRLVVPLSHFIERPFQNWTRTSADLLGTVFVYTDYTVPVEEVRREVTRILEASGMWDGKVAGLQVTNADARTMELRALMSAPNASVAWDLRCHVRERLIEFLQQKYPSSLPKARAEIRQMAELV